MSPVARTLVEQSRAVSTIGIEVDTVGSVGVTDVVNCMNAAADVNPDAAIAVLCDATAADEHRPVGIVTFFRRNPVVTAAANGDAVKHHHCRPRRVNDVLRPPTAVKYPAGDAGHARARHEYKLRQSVRRRLVGRRR